MTGPVHVLLISGSTRGQSTNTAALRTLAALAPAAVTPVLYGGLAALPAFNPDQDGDPNQAGNPARDGPSLLPAPVAALRRQVAAAGAVLFCTPEYAGTLPGSLKNLLDWTVGGGEIYGKPAAWVNVAAAGRGGGATATLASVLGYVGAEVVSEACRDIAVGRSEVGPDGLVTAPAFAAAAGQLWQALLSRLDPSGAHPA